MEISSAPYLIDPTQFGLDDLHKNQKRLADIKKKYPSDDLGDYRGQNLAEYKVGPNESYIIAEDNLGKGQQVVYLAHLKIERLKSLSDQSVTQVEVWRSAGSFVRPQITKHVFFDILLKRYKYVVSDKSQTERGRDFWFARLSEADDLGHKVGIILDDNVTWKGDEAFGPWMRLAATEAWGKENVHYDTRLVIAK
jgi:hypothetical protein